MKYLLFLLLCLFAFTVHGQRSYIYFIESDLPQLDFKIVENYFNDDFITINGRVSLEDITEKTIFAGVTLFLELDGVMYKTECDEDTDKRGVFTIKYPVYVYKNKKVKKNLKIERLGYKTELINIDKYRKSDTLEISLKKQSITFPSIKVEGNNYYVNIRDLETIPKQYYLSDFFEVLYNQLCDVLSKDDSWRNMNKIEYLFEFDKRGVLMNINSNFQNETIIEFFEQQKLRSPRVQDSTGIPSNITLTIYNTMK